MTTVTRDDFERLLISQFKDIMQTFRDIRSQMAPEIISDFLGLVQYLASHHSALKSLLKNDEILLNPSVMSCPALHPLPPSIVDELISRDLDSFAPEFTLFPQILSERNSFDRASLYSLCLKHWKCRYPSIKESFIIPLCAHLFEAHPGDLNDQPLLVDLLRKRIYAGKLVPFDESVRLAKCLGVDFNQFSFVYRPFSTLKEILSNHQNISSELESVLKQSGCHCD